MLITPVLLNKKTCQQTAANLLSAFRQTGIAELMQLFRKCRFY